MMKLSTARAYTLVETLIAIGIMSLLMLSITSFVTGMLSGERHNRAIAEVEAQGQYILSTFTQVARNSGAITSPATSTAATAVNFGTPSNGFALAGNTITIRRGTAAATILTSSTVTASNVLFSNVSSTTARAVRMQFTLSYANPSGRSDSVFSEQFSTTVTLR